ncbi:proline dehydrogenase [Pseudonocardia sp. WMMC193]|uniref:proline dehydrogenase n=1 Tax=Pseudonocardia sp. WMMC193 TaxID=2911965 RepID=UPI001F2C70B4|nr:proline dehydrogenase [Pseudonocardia sp. WMMC193]MCF7551757.1 proline dehydrogenase [Pseudonocardia sp. WMMC193]
MTLALGTRYVAGERFADVETAVRGLHDTGIAAVVGRFAPVAADGATARATAAAYTACARRLGGLPAGTRLEVDLPHLGVDGDPDLAADLLCDIAAALPPGSAVQCGAEEAWRTDAVLGAVLAARGRGAPVRATVQANLRRSPLDVDVLVADGVPIRLVKGGFRESATDALVDPDAVDRRIRSLTYVLHVRGAEFTVATHDPQLQDWCAGLDPTPPIETLYGVLPERATALAGRGPVRTYVPFGVGGEEYVAARTRAEEAHRC